MQFDRDAELAAVNTAIEAGVVITFTPFLNTRVLEVARVARSSGSTLPDLYGEDIEVFARNFIGTCYTWIGHSLWNSIMAQSGASRIPLAEHKSDPAPVQEQAEQTGGQPEQSLTYTLRVATVEDAGGRVACSYIINDATSRVELARSKQSLGINLTPLQAGYNGLIQALSAFADYLTEQNIPLERASLKIISSNEHLIKEIRGDHPTSMPAQYADIQGFIQVFQAVTLFYHRGK